MRHLLTTAVALVASGALILTPAAVAVADPIVFPADQTTVEYGTYWQIQSVATPTPYNPYSGAPQFRAIIAMHGAPSGYLPEGYVYQGAAVNTSNVVVSPQSEARPLSAGSYSFDLAVVPSYNPNTIVAGTTSSQPFTITAAALGIEARIVPDTANPAQAIVSARFTGNFAETFFTSQFSYSPYTPAGAWHLAITDADGEVTDWSADRGASDDTLAVSFLWPDAKPGEQYTLTASFTPSGESATNFTIADSSEFSYTAPKAERAVPVSDAPAPAALEPMQVAVFSVPIWWLVLAGLLVAGLATLLAVVLIRLRRPRAPAPPSSPSQASPPQASPPQASPPRASQPQAPEQRVEPDHE